jgi:E3 ubiquitin-protein ligase DOA10
MAKPGSLPLFRHVLVETVVLVLVLLVLVLVMVLVQTSKWCAGG